jgi:aryl-alcohol dehydrogenase-like predicted oxidoreductase
MIRGGMKGKLPLENGKHVDFAIGLGTAGLSGKGGGFGYGHLSKEDAIETLNHAMDRGIKLIDCAPLYGFREAEMRVGEIAKKRRDEIFLMSKCGLTWHSSMRVNHSNEPAICQKMLEQSLKDLKTDYLDCYFVHYPDKKVDIRYTMEVLSKAKRENKILSIGLSNSNLTELEKALEIDDVEVFQEKQNIFDSNFDYLTDFQSENKFRIGYGTLDQGLLSGRVFKQRKFETCDHRSFAPSWKKRDLDKDLGRSEFVKCFAEKEEVSLLSLCLAGSFRETDLEYALVGMKTKKDIDTVVDAYMNMPPKSLINKFRSKNSEQS